LASRMLMSSCRRRETGNGVEPNILFDIGISCTSTDPNCLVAQGPLACRGLGDGVLGGCGLHKTFDIMWHRR
jgi:hypothetical protein